MSFHMFRRALVVMLLFAARPASAAFCAAYPSQGVPQTVSFGTIQIPADMAPGSVIGERSSVGWTSAGFNCVNPRRTGSLGVYRTPSALGQGISDTNVPGVGIRVYYVGRYGDTLVPYGLPVKGVFNGKLVNAHFRIQLIKTGAIAQGGSLSAGLLAQTGYDGTGQVSVNLLDARVEPQRPTCAFLSQRLVFALGKVDGGTLAATGSSGWATQPMVSTGCRNATQILMTFRGTADAADPSLFRLDGPGAASGVAVELRSDDANAQVVPNSPRPLVLRALKEGHSYGFRARYRTTGKRLVAGSANARITVNVSYY